MRLEREAGLGGGGNAIWLIGGEQATEREEENLRRAEKLSQ